MQNKRYAFTIIELVFVIVILGILAAVAIPKLVATRDDAKVSKFAQNIGTSIQDITDYTISKDKTDANFSVMSNCIKGMVAAGDANLTNDEVIILIDGKDCIKIKVDKNATGSDLNVSYVSSTNHKCKSLQSTVKQTNYSMKLKGQNVVY